MKLKTGYCKQCGNTEPKPIIAGLCSYHYWKSKKKPIVFKPVKINPVSKNRKIALSKYEKEKKEYFKENPVCEFPECNSTEISLHHSKGRIGSLLTDKRYFKSLCWPHHKYVEENPEEAKRLNLSFLRLSK